MQTTLDPVHRLTEGDVIDAVCRDLVSRGFSILAKRATTERGDDIIANRESPLSRIYIEAKGATSSREGSSRHGKPFNGAQVSDHVAMAFFKAAETLESFKHRDNVRVCIALPKTLGHRSRLLKIRSIVQSLNIGIFWVTGSTSVEFEAPWDL